MNELESGQEPTPAKSDSIHSQPEIEKEEQTEPVKASATKKKSTSPSKMKFQLHVPTEHPFYAFGEVLKQRKAKALDLGALTLEALASVEKDWWTKKLEELTPIEYRINLALKSPELREELSSFLEQKLPSSQNDADSVH